MAENGKRCLGKKTVNIVTQSNLQSGHSSSKIGSVHFSTNKGWCNHLLLPIKKMPCTKQSIITYVPYLVFLVTILWECFPYQGQIEIHHSSFAVSFSAYPADQNAVCSKIYSQISLLDQMHNYLEKNNTQLKFIKCIQNYWQQMHAMELMNVFMAIMLMTLHVSSNTVSRHTAKTSISSLFLSS